VTLYVHGSSPYGFGDLLGKGGPNLVGLQKQAGFMIAWRDQTLRRCKVISRAFGHRFYIQKRAEVPDTDNVLLEDCYAEGTVRPTADMLRDTSGLLAGWNYRTVAENRDGPVLVVSGYMKSLSEDGFRAYGGTKRVTLVNCTAVNTRAGFEVNGPDEGNERTVVENCHAIGCERAYLLGSNVLVRHSRGDTRYGPLLYLRGGAIPTSSWSGPAANRTSPSTPWRRSRVSITACGWSRTSRPSAPRRRCRSTSVSACPPTRRWPARSARRRRRTSG
jgi:hypothetical protein